MSRDFDDELDPYAPPKSAIKGSTSVPESSEFRLFLLWEKLRLLYNAILGVETVWLMVNSPPRMPHGFLGLLPGLAMLCLAANVCFCLGPVLNGYAYHWIGLRHRSVTALIFASGTIVAVLLTFMTSVGFGP